MAAGDASTMRDKSDAITQTVHVLWINAGLSCDGDSVALTSATQPSIEDIALGVLPGLPQVQFHWPLIDYENGPVGLAAGTSATRCARASGPPGHAAGAARACARRSGPA